MEILEITIDVINIVGLILAISVAFFTFSTFNLSNKIDKAVGKHKTPIKMRKKHLERLNIGLGFAIALLTIMSFFMGKYLSNEKDREAKAKEKAADVKIARADSVAAISNKLAAKANQETEILKAKSIETQNQVSIGRKQIIKLDINLSDAKTQQAIAQKENALAQLALNKKIEEDRLKAKPRTFTAKQRTELISLLKQMPVPENPVSIAAISGDGEAKSYALELVDILNSVNWPNTGVGEVILAGTFTGVAVNIQSKDTRKIPRYAFFFLNVFKKLGIEYFGSVNADMAPDSYGIIIGHKH